MNLNKFVLPLLLVMAVVNYSFNTPKSVNGLIYLNKIIYIQQVPLISFIHLMFINKFDKCRIIYEVIIQLSCTSLLLHKACNLTLLITGHITQCYFCFFSKE